MGAGLADIAGFKGQETGPFAALPHGRRARLGMMMPSGNAVAEPQFSAMLPLDVSLHVTRLRLTGSSPEQLNAMADNVEEAASLVADVQPGLIGFHCTAVSTSSAELERSILERAYAAGGVSVVATSQAICAVLETLGARRIVLVTPYVDHINASEIAFLERNGFEVADEVGLGLFHAHEMAEVEPQKWYELALEHRNPDADAYFISCTAVRSLEVIEPLERDLRKPVLTSNQVMAWHMLRTIGVSDRITGFGQLLSDH